MSNSRAITVIKGQEYKVCQINMKDEQDFLHDSYLKAQDCLEDIEKFGEDIVRLQQSKIRGIKQNHLSYENINNIIAFCGERGQGKTSALMSYANILSEDYGNKYYIMKVIDPTSLEKNDNILMMILSAIFHEFMKKKDASEYSYNETDNNRIIELFHKVYHHISTIKFPSSTMNTDFDETMENLTKYGDSMNLRESFKELITEFMKKNGNAEGYFVISIDDTDLNIERAFEIVEDIRKYLTIPNVIILMATKLEQLNIAVEQHFRQSYKTMTDAKRISDAEISQMASKYLDKLIPETRRINIPKICSTDENGNLPNIIYKENSSETSKNILEEYGNDLQEQMIKLIEAKTAISFDIDSSSGIHWIIPQTMRELVNLLAFLCKMDTVGRYENGAFYFKIERDENKTNRPVIKKLYNNINEFYTYFRTCWMVNNLNDEEINGIEKIITSDLRFTHMQTLLELKKRVGALDDTLKNSSPDKATNTPYGKASETLVSRIDKIIESQSLSNTYGHSLGDIMDAIMAVEKCACLDNVLKFTFAIKTVYTIKMMLTAVAEIMGRGDGADNLNTLSSSAVIKFIGIDFIGKYNTNSLFPTVRGSEVCRGRFNLPLESFSDEFKKALSNSEMYLNRLIFQGYKDSDYNYLQNRSENNVSFSNLYCNISYYFIFTIMDAVKCRSNVVFKLLNVEKIFNIISKQLQFKDKIKKEATLRNLCIGFFEWFQDFSFRVDIVEELKKDERYIEELDKVMKDVLLKQQKKSSFFNARKRAMSNDISRIEKHIKEALGEEETWPSEVKEKIILEVTELINNTSRNLESKTLTNEQKDNLYEEANRIIAGILSEDE